MLRIFVIFIMSLFWFVFTQDYGITLFLSSLIMVTEQSCLVLVFCEIVHAQQENTKA